MLATPDTYPQTVINAMVEEEDFTEYIHTINGDVSYAQLSALLAFSAEINELNADSFSKREQEKTDTEDVSVSKKLCKKILRVVVQYAEKNNLDRGNESYTTVLHWLFSSSSHSESLASYNWGDGNSQRTQESCGNPKRGTHNCRD